MKLCINCQYYDRNMRPPAPKDGRAPVVLHQPGMALCLHPSTMDRTSLISGEPVRYTDRAGVGNQRYTTHLFAVIFDRCGPRGRHFVPVDISEPRGAKT